MKKSIVTLAAILTLTTGAASAAPIHNLAGGETAIGVGTNESYIEHQVSDDFALGYQRADRDEYGDHDDIYGQFRLNNNLRAIVGHRDLNYDTNFYAGLAASVPLTPNMDGYASFVTGSDFKETQIGTNVSLISNVELNINYHSFSPDRGHNEDGFGVGATVRF
ncbi:hypothetical protein [Anaerosinus massiliensis]|uniref:hypothetical protein n=1 Tax=Massilibacillus massiliensis TaxID=1806837 RepID=UPI000DA62D85|nr:hypothetical protein [Massilibacillus massiliensis]